MQCYEHTDVKSTLIGATVQKKQLPYDYFIEQKGKLYALFILII